MRKELDSLSFLREAGDDGVATSDSHLRFVAA